MVRQLHLPRGNAPLCIIEHLKSVSSSEFEPLHYFTLVGLLQSLGCGVTVQLQYVRTLNTPFKLLVSASSHVQVTSNALIDRPDPLSLCSGEVSFG